MEANIKALNRGSKEVFNIGTGKETSIKELFHMIKKIMDIDIKAEYGKEQKGDIKKIPFF